MVEDAEKHMDTLLQQLADDAVAGTPRPGPDLMARVLADASDVIAAQPRAAAANQTVAPTKPGIMDFFLGWAGGAVAAMAVALVIGIGVGMEIEPGNVPFMDTEEDTLTIADGGFMPEDIL
ncbi:MAG: hypothetical protein AAF557_21505 [Pseudomonadota bacterium]